MPNIDDILEPILNDLATCEDHASELLANGASVELMAMARVATTIRPVLDELVADRAIAPADIATLRAVRDEIAEYGMSADEGGEPDEPPRHKQRALAVLDRLIGGAS